MPQLIPLYFINQVSYLYIVFIVLLIIISKIILPYFPRLSLIRETLIKGR
nr:ATP synthase F0 subunit 8 [Capillidium rhysosporum]QWY25720.1 ATP synthase F0 subunit 8 [Capillidium rhysosporum]